MPANPPTGATDHTDSNHSCPSMKISGENQHRSPLHPLAISEQQAWHK